MEITPSFLACRAVLQVWSLQRQWRTSGILDAVEAAATAAAEDTADTATELEARFSLERENLVISIVMAMAISYLRGYN